MSNRNRRIGLWIAVLIAALAVPAAALAQRPGRPGPDGPRHPLGRILQQLDLTAEQQTRIHEIVFANREARQEQAQQMREARQALRQAVQAQTSDEAAIRAAATRVAELQADRAVARARVLGQVREQLAPEQLERFNDLLARVADRGGHRWHPRGGPRCGFGPGTADL